MVGINRNADAAAQPKTGPFHNLGRLERPAYFSSFLLNC
jgi:hypothetical protein